MHLTSIIRRRPLTAFLLWFFTVGVAVSFIPVVTDGGGLPPQLYIVASTLVGLLLPTLVITRIVDGPEGLRALWSRAVQFRASLVWYVLALVAVPVVAVALTVLLVGPPDELTPGRLATALLTAAGPAMLLTWLPNNWWEEVAWTGFVQARLQDRRGPLVAALLTGPLFALQHVALVADGTLAEATFLLTLLALLAIPFRFLVAWVYNRTSSLFLIGLLHASGNAVAGGSGFHPGFLRSLYPDSALSGMAHLLAYAALGLLVLAATRGRLGSRRLGNRRLGPGGAAPASAGVRVPAARRPSVPARTQR